MPKPVQAAAKPRRRPKVDSTLPRHGNRSIVVGVALLNVIAKLGKPAALSEIAAAAAMSPTRTHRYLLGLVRTRLIDHNALTGRYDLGSQIIELGVAALGRVDAVRLGIEALAGLTEETRHASLICVWGTNGPTVIRWEQADLMSAVRVREGRTLSLLRSASGRIFHAFMPQTTIETFLAKEIEAWNGTHPSRDAFTPARLQKLRAEVVAHGMAQGIGEESADMAALAAPVFDATGRIALCVTLISTIGSLDTSYEGAPARALRRMTETLSRNLGAGAQAPRPTDDVPHTSRSAAAAV
jgi:DNA-binding IclR family transcriptional regulator